jgi:hypothetical protein
LERNFGKGQDKRKGKKAAERHGGQEELRIIHGWIFHRQNRVPGWGHVCLMIDVSSSTMRSVIKAGKFEEDVNVPPEKFAVPVGYDVK